MITKIDIKNFGLYRDYLWSEHIGKTIEFKRLNIIYGRNYSGKTTLSRIFKYIEDGRVHKNYNGSKFTLTQKSGSPITEMSLISSYKVRVYNSDFVRENLNWLYNEDGTIKPFTILGAKNIQLEKKILEIKETLGSPEDGKGLLFRKSDLYKKVLSGRADFEKKSNDLEELLKKKANEKIKMDNNLFVMSKDKKSYTVADIRSEITSILKDIDKHLLQPASVTDRENLLREVLMPDVTKLSEKGTNFEAYYNEANELLSRKIKPNKAITSLLNDSLLQEWVRQGIERHKGVKMHCEFCGGPISDELWQKLDAHFSKESESLRKDIDILIGKLESNKLSIARNLQINKNEFYSSVWNELEKITDEWKKNVTLYCNNIDTLIGNLKLRQNEVFTPIEAKQLVDVSDLLLDSIENINKLVDIHNTKSGTLSLDQINARTELRHAHIANFISDIDYSGKMNEIATLEEKYKQDDKDLATILAQINKYEKELKSIEVEANDETRGAEIVNQYLSHYFGHNELKLVAEVATPSVVFKIQRNGVAASNLSEGECSLISFCYFVAKMEDELKDEENYRNLLIYIDDPISSLDSNHIFFLFSLIENVFAKPDKYGQLFISTHSLDFLKYLKRLTIPRYKPYPGSKSKEDLNHFLIDRRSKDSTKLVLAPNYLKKYITEFNYLFSQIYKCSIANDDVTLSELQYNFGNNVRKFLESYLFFKYPNHAITNDQRLKSYFGSDQISLTLISRLINEYSHLEEQFDRGIIPIDLGEIKKIAKLIVDKIKDSDAEQYNSLVECVKSDMDEL